MPERLTDHPAYRLLLDLLRDQIGLDPASACTGNVPAALAGLGVTADPKLVTYVQAALRQPLLLHDLIKQIVVHETWFFREPVAFEVLTRAALRAVASGRRFRVLSAPCSTGEEPYSIALALTEAGVPHELIDIVAIDISGDAVQQARRGDFADMAFRGLTPEWRDARFVREGQRWRLRTGLEQLIRFETGNLMNLPTLIAHETFDAVFCRNLLIYLDLAARAKLFATLRALARPDTGLIFVGHAESTDAFHGELERVAQPMSFAFHNRPGAAYRALPAKPVSTPRRDSLPGLSGALSRRTENAAGPALASWRPVPAQADDPLHAVRLLADKGDLASAVTVCEQVIRAHTDLADARCYRGVLAVAAGQPEVARGCFAKALYLDPRHEDSLHHLMLLAQGEGDTAGAERYRERLQRVGAAIAGAPAASSNRSQPASGADAARGSRS